ncbi:serine/threonine-protein phosphatase 7 long form homolog [Gastrolobium bilobum]|uniref:serine/threonine-protein phosphatase 7 long form homolog n=1 Tax=Gastrolobium bilobum TaxID=150636 RepID=UPI002AB1D51F|nr:serine/threonine-protein phosphatase 7 long form homolog [Gastrolobium bilobum]
MAADDSSARRLHPGPRINTVLHMQSTHRSEVVWMEEQDYKSLNVRSGRLAGLDVIPEPIVPYLRHADFLGAARMGRMEIDSALVTTLVERWRPETHTFHMHPGEVTVTLEDVAIITGLPTDGEPVTGMSETRELKALVPQLLGRTPSPADFKGGSLKMSWLDANFTNVEEWMDDEENLL